MLNDTRKLLVLVGLGVFLLFPACTENRNDLSVDFDRSAMLEFWYDDIILPANLGFEAAAENLVTAHQNYLSKADSSSLHALHSAFKEAYLRFEEIKAFQVGPSADLNLRANLNTYPTDSAQIVSLASSRTFNPGAANQLDAQGLPALDLLLFQAGLNWTSSPDLRWMVEQNVNFIRAQARANASAWKNYRATFVNATGTDVSSSLGQLVNAINQDFELIKNAKLGFPAGKKTFGTPYPRTVEAFYSGWSLELAKANLQSIANFYKGINYTQSRDGLSIYDNLMALGSLADGAQLAEDIDQRFQTAEQKLEAIPETLSQSILSNPNSVDEAYSHIQATVIYLKTDMPSALGVIITYQDNDGD